MKFLFKIQSVNVMRKYKLFITAYLLFIISLFLPSLKLDTIFVKDEVFYGFNCFFWSIWQLPDFFNFGRETFISTLVFANIYFLLSPFYLKKKQKFPIISIGLIFASILVSSTPLVILDDGKWLVGFYVWCSSYFLLAFYFIFTSRSEKT